MRAAQYGKGGYISAGAEKLIEIVRTADPTKWDSIFYWIKADSLLCNTVQLSLKAIELNAIVHQSPVRKTTANWRILNPSKKKTWFASDCDGVGVHSVPSNGTSNQICRAIDSIIGRTL